MTREPGMHDGQAAAARDSNREFFLKNLERYRNAVATWDTYRLMHDHITREVAGIGRLLDIGNGGVFAYDTAAVGEIVALDLFFDQITEADARSLFPANVTARTGSALSIPEADGSFDAAVMVMLIHHLVGDTVQQSIANVETALREAWRVVRPGGRVIVVESCVPRWFYGFERIVFRPAAAIIGAILDHPHTIQYPVTTLADILRRLGADVSSYALPVGRWVIQYGFKWPVALTPARAYVINARRPLQGTAA